jgi:hypothetical protein
MQSHAEHQKHDADVRQLLRQAGVGNKSWREGTHDDAGNQIPHDRRKFQPGRCCPEHESEPEAHGQHRYERGVGLQRNCLSCEVDPGESTFADRRFKKQQIRVARPNFLRPR